MGRPPAYIFVVRHGNRLDAADKQWHLSSPTPYDPPLTYGGWMHSRNVGARIAAILRDDATADAAVGPPSSPSSTPPKRRRFRVVLHSSPFLRCVQTSIAISAGLASNPNPAEPVPAQPSTLRVAQTPSLSNPAPTKSRPDVPVSTSAGPHQHHHEHHHEHEHDLTASFHRHIEKTVLRLDPFLGEWLSPDYFEHITPPPKSALMLATAKAELLRRSSYHDYPHFHHRIHSSASSHLWSSTSGHHSTPGNPPAHNPRIHSTPSFDTLSYLADSLPSPEAESNGDSHPKPAREASHHHPRAPGYVFPVPSYALSTSEPIPKGYVAHARDACASIDYQWDSSRDSLAWGDGGTLPEEWASMHQRFRRGLRRLVDWYGSTDDENDAVTRTANTSRPSESDHIVSGEQDNEIEAVVVLVSHGAGCNALIGALTQQPVLADIGMSSLTMAQRRVGFDSRNVCLTRQKSLSSLDTALHHMSRATMPEMYDLKLFANTDHLAAPSPPSGTPSLSRPNARSRFGSGFTSSLKEINFGSLYGSSSGSGRDHSANASLGSMRRSSGGSALVMAPSVYNANTGGVTVGGGMSSFSVTRPDRSGSGTWGLWSPRQDESDNDEGPETPMFLNFSHEKATKAKKSRETARKDENPASLIDAHKLASAVTPSGKEGKSPGRGLEQSSEHHDEEHDTFDEEAIPRLWAGTGNGGLWGTPRPPGEAERLRDFSASKRRWTVTER